MVGPTDKPRPPADARGDFLSIFLQILTLGALLLSLASCTTPGAAPPAGNRAVPEASSFVFTDGIGREVRLDRSPQRIISLAPSVTEVLYLLGAGDRVIGVTAHCDWPEDARRKPIMGTLLSPNFETILAARPDLVIASTAGNDRASTLRLADLGVPLFVTAPRSVAGIFDTVLGISRIAGCPEKGQALAGEMHARLERIRQRLSGTPPTRAFFITWFEPLLAPGRQTFENDVLRFANVTTISADIDEFYPRFSLEQVLARDPDVVLTVQHEGSPLPDLKLLPGWNFLSAVKKDRVYILSELLQHPSPRFIDGLEELAMKLYPERFR